jgi:hypothetical protein
MFNAPTSREVLLNRELLDIYMVLDAETSVGFVPLHMEHSPGLCSPRMLLASLYSGFPWTRSQFCSSLFTASAYT